MPDGFTDMKMRLVLNGKEFEIWELAPDCFKNWSDKEDLPNSALGPVETNR